MMMMMMMMMMDHWQCWHVYDVWESEDQMNILVLF
jgi:hypothetical protein